MAYFIAHRAEAVDCGRGIAFQVLGSGGPMPNSRRASAGYLLWVDGHARVLFDAGGGTYARFGSAGARIEDLRLIALTHLHADHAVELPAYIKGGYFSSRQAPLPVSGPAAQGQYPGMRDFMRRLFDGQRGAFAYLNGTLDGTEGQFQTPAIEIAVDGSRVQPVLDEPGLRVLALPVEHGPVPTIAYRIEVRDKVIVYAADQNGDRPEFPEFARGADLLIMPLAIPEAADDNALRLHATPSEVGAIATASDARQLLLSHIMPSVEAVLDDAQGRVKAAYKHPVVIAEDMACIQFNAQPVSKR